jgi:ribosomal protein L32
VRPKQEEEVVDVEVIEDEDEIADVKEIDDEEDRPRRRRRPRMDNDEEDEEEDRPRRRRKRRRTGPYATCPNCGERGDAHRVSYTLWGGFVGPWLLTHVRCNNCGTAYNGKTGNYNTTGIVLWVVIPLAITIVAVVFGTLMRLLAK